MQGEHTPARARSDVARIGSLEAGQDLAFERRWWVVQRASWAAMVIVLAAGLGGACGRGPLCRSRHANSGVVVELPRVGRFNFGAEMKLHVTSDAMSDAPDLRIRVPVEFARCAGIERTTPRAVSEALTGADLVYTFSRGTPEDTPVQVLFHLRPVALGPCSARIVAGGVGLQVTHFVLP